MIGLRTGAPAISYDTPGISNAVPLYHRIYIALRDDILSGRRPDGSNLPTEHELAELHGVSRITARRALNELAGEGLVSRRPRQGTRVTHRARPAAIAADLDQALETLISFGRETSVKVINIRTVAADTSIATALDVEPGTPVIEAVRMRFRDEAPLGRVTSHAVEALAPIFKAEELLRRPLLALVRELGHEIGSARETISARAADEAMAAMLGIEWRAPLLVVERLLKDAHGAPLLRTLAEYRADSYRIELSLNAGAHD